METKERLLKEQKKLMQKIAVHLDNIEKGKYDHIIRKVKNSLKNNSKA